LTVSGGRRWIGMTRRSLADSAEVRALLARARGHQVAEGVAAGGRNRLAVAAHAFTDLGPVAASVGAEFDHIGGAGFAGGVASGHDRRGGMITPRASGLGRRGGVLSRRCILPQGGGGQGEDCESGGEDEAHDQTPVGPTERGHVVNETRAWGRSVARGGGYSGLTLA
jgi:hypothetical protein